MKITRTVVGIVGGMLLAMEGLSAPEGTFPRNDFLIMAQATKLAFRASDLLANDNIPTTFGPLQIVILLPPTHGLLERKGDVFTYVPKADYFGRDMFQYAIADGDNHLSMPAKVTVEVAPDVVALRGDFDGDGRRDWGWFQSADATFHVCYNYPSDHARCSVLWTAPARLVGRMPIVGDWNGDRRDDVGLFDESNGWFHLAVLPSGPTPVSFPFGVGGGLEVPVAGDWNGDGRDSVGTFQSGTARFRLRNQNASGPIDYDFIFGEALLSPNVIGARLPGLAADVVGLHVDHKLHLYKPLTGEKSVTQVRCEATPSRLPLEYTPGFGLTVYDVRVDVATNCMIQVPIDVYIPPPDGNDHP
jgi:hypothetical protein